MSVDEATAIIVFIQNILLNLYLIHVFSMLPEIFCSCIITQLIVFQALGRVPY